MVSYGGNPMRKKPTFRNSTGHCTMDFKTIQEIPSPKKENESSSIQTSIDSFDTHRRKMRK